MTWYRPLQSVAKDYVDWATSDHPRVATGFPIMDDRTSGGAAAGEVILFQARSQVGKCVTGDTRVLLADGSYVPIESLDGEVTVLALDEETQALVPATASWLYTGVKPTVVVRTKHGRTITTTAEHPYLTPTGWVRVADLGVGDCIAVPTDVPVFGDRSVPDHEAAFLGLWLAEGSGSNSSPQITTTVYGEEVAAWAKAFGCTAVPSEMRVDMAQSYRIVAYRRTQGEKRIPNPALQFLSSLGLVGCKSADKHVPADVFTWDRASIALLLRWLFNGDGWLCHRNTNGFEVGFCSMSERLVRDVSHLLLRFGVVGTVRRKVNAWMWAAQRTIDVARFVERIGIDRPAAAEVTYGGKGREGVILFDPVVDISPAPPQDVYDLVVSEHHNFLAEDIVAHNTAVACNVINHLCPEPVVFFSLEMAGRYIAMRMAAIHSNHPTANVEWELKETGRSEALQRLVDDFPDLIIIDEPAMSIKQMDEALAEVEQKLQRRPALVVMDYLELIGGAALSAVEKIDMVSRKVKDLTRKHDTVTLLLHQVGRGAGGAGAEPLSLESGRYGGETAADYVLGAYRSCLRLGITQDEYLEERWQVHIQFLKTRGGSEIHPQGLLHQINPHSMKITYPYGRVEPLFPASAEPEEAAV